MNVKYRISEKDYVNAMLLFASWPFRIVVAYVVLVALLIALATLVPPIYRDGIIGAVLGLVSFILLLRYLFIPIMARRDYQKYKTIQDEFSVELLEDGIFFTAPDAECKLVWDKILQWRENKDYVLIYPMPKMYHIVPKSVASQGFDVAALTASLKQHVGEPV